MHIPQCIKTSAKISKVHIKKKRREKKSPKKKEKKSSANTLQTQDSEKYTTHLALHDDASRGFELLLSVYPGLNLNDHSHGMHCWT